MKLLLATGGTGGHIYPALAVADALASLGGEAAVLGQAGGMEARVVPEHGVAFHGVRAGKWDREHPDVRQAFAAVAGLVGAIQTVRRLRPDAVVGFGGFASFPGCFAATVLGVPLYLHEGNAYPGRVVRWFQGRAKLVLAAQPEVAERLPRARHVETVGFPVREKRVDTERAREALGLPQQGVVTLVMGGSQGSLALNERIPEAFRQLPESARPTVLHSTGPKWLASVRDATAWPNYHTTPYVDATLAWSAADLAITRAGISTLAEAAFHGVPVIAVPLPSSAEDHQRFNARAVAAAGAGRYVEQSDAAGLVEAWQSLLDLATRERAATAALERSPEGAARLVVETIAAELGAAPDRGPKPGPKPAPPSTRTSGPASSPKPGKDSP